MSRVQGYLITTAGCIISLVAFFFLPYLAITFPGNRTYSFTGFQLIDAKSIASTLSSASYNKALPGQIQFPWFQVLLVALVLLLAVVQLVLEFRQRRDKQASWRGALSVFLLAGVVLLLLLCRYFGDYQSLILLVPSSQAAQLNAPQISGSSLYNLGFLVFLIGAVLAVVGGVVALRAKR